MSVSCDDATHRLTYTCEAGWEDANQDPSDGCESSTAGLQPISFDPVAAATLAESIFHSVDTIEVQPDCAGTLEAACTGGTPADPLPTMTADTASHAGDRARVEAVPDVANSRYDITLRLRLRTDSAIPITLPVVGACGLRIDTAPNDPDLTVTFHDNVVAPEGPTVVSGVALSGLESSDYELSGSFGCQVAATDPTMFTDVLARALTPWVTRRAVVCGAPAPDYFQGCPTSP
jgi:hypothetical protein